jgi:hypothetical protein
MTCTDKTPSPRGWSAKLIASVALGAVLVLGVSAVPASARWDHDNGYGGYNRGWSGGYYRSPPVVYGSPYRYGYYPPPVVYGPGIGVNLPGVSIGIR